MVGCLLSASMLPAVAGSHRAHRLQTVRPFHLNKPPHPPHALQIAFRNALQIRVADTMHEAHNAIGAYNRHSHTPAHAVQITVADTMRETQRSPIKRPID